MWRRYHLSDLERKVPNLFLPTGTRNSSNCRQSQRVMRRREREEGHLHSLHDLSVL
jgi:hypothetical protein